jgi:2-polyprenyl-3-methyl-5-hydroxy-6-metoxy-1,4-benzoquinol methylase
VKLATKPRQPRRSGGFVLNAGAVDHYQDPANYDRLYAARTEDRDFYLRRARSARTILEYGAGTGRLTLPLLSAGKAVTAVDTSRAMLGTLTQRATLAGADVRSRLSVRVADMRTFATSQRYDQVIVGFHALGHLYSHRDVVSFLTRAFRHLRPHGEILLDLPLPNLDLPGYDGAAQVLVSEMDGAHGTELLTLRLFQPQELLMHLHYAGFTDAALFGDFHGGALETDSEVMVACARSPKC